MAPAFAEKVALGRVGWPSLAEQERARGIQTDSGRDDALRWLIRIVAPQQRPFPPPEQDPPAEVLRRDESGQLRWVPGREDTPDASRPKAREYAKRLTAAISDDDQDLLCARWSTSAYHFQFIAAQELIRLSVEPVRPSPRDGVTPEDAAVRAREFLLNVLNDANRLLNFCDLQAEKTDYGCRVTVRCRDYAAWHQQFQPPEEQLYHRWFLRLVVHTDGDSFVLDVRPMMSANVVGSGGRPLQRWFAPPRGPTSQPSPTTAPAPDPDEVKAKLKRLKELAEQRRREREARQPETQPQR